MALIDTVNRTFREFRRYTGDGLPGEPTNAPLPIGDPQSGVQSPKKSEIRASFAEVLTGIEAVEQNVAAFNARYLGSFAADPTTDGDGNPITEGALYWSSNSLSMRVYSGGEWRPTGTKYRGAWDSATPYSEDDLVESGGSIWLAKQTSTNSAPVEGADWTLFLPGVTVAAGTVTDTMVVPFGATSPRAGKILFEAPIAAPALRSVSARLWDTPSIRDWNALGNNVDDTAAVQAAAAYCATNQSALYIPRGDYVLVDTVDLTKAFAIVGDGPLVSKIIPRNFNGSAFRYVTDGEAISFPTMRNLEIVFDFPDELAPHELSTCIEFAGDENFIQEGTFRDLFLRGSNYIFRNSKPSHSTSFGEEGTVAWMKYQNIQITDYHRPVNVGWHFPTGSGTGNVWDGIRSRMDDPSAYLWRFEGYGCVVGDILILNSNIGSPANGFLGGDNTVYRRNIRIAGSQFDAGMTNPIVLSPVGPVEWNDYDIKDNNFGGGTSLANLPLSHGARYTGNEVGRLEDGKRITFNTGGAKGGQVFRVHIAPFSGCVLEFSIAGLVGGVGGGVARLLAIASRQDGVPTVTGIDQTRSPDLAGYPQLTVGTADDYVYFGFTCTPVGGDTELNAQVVVQNGTARIEQL